MFGDFVFTLSTFPIYYVLEKWRTTFRHGDSDLESESDLSDAPISRSHITPKRFAASDVAATGNVCTGPGEFPKTPNSRRPVDLNTKQSSSDSVRSVMQSNQTIDVSQAWPFSRQGTYDLMTLSHRRVIPLYLLVMTLNTTKLRLLHRLLKQIIMNFQRKRFWSFKNMLRSGENIQLFLRHILPRLF